MATTIVEKATQDGPPNSAVFSPVAGKSSQALASRLTSQQVWQEVAGASFAVISYVTRAGEPRSSGVVYKTVGPRLCISVAPDSWKARQIAATGEVSVTVPIRRGGVLALAFPIPPATVSFQATATVYPAGSPQARAVLKDLAPLLPPDARDTGSIIEVTPKGAFLTYGLGVSLMTMRNRDAARARVPVV